MRWEACKRIVSENCGNDGLNVEAKTYDAKSVCLESCYLIGNNENFLIRVY